MELLDSALNRRLAFNSQLFRWNVAYARLAGLLGEPGARQRAARKALRLAEEGPVLPRHPTVGVVHADEETLAWLRGVAGSR